MKPPPFEYHSPRTIDEALTLMGQLDGALPLAGGQSLIPLLNLRLAYPRHLVDLGRIPELEHHEVSGDEVRVGAMTTHHSMQRSLVGDLPLVSEAVTHVGFPAIRARGTLGGSLAHADPAGELPLVSLVLEAEIVLRSAHGERSVAAPVFFLGPYTTARRPDELITQVRFAASPEMWGFSEFARRTGDYALVACAVALDIEDGQITNARVGLAGVADRPLRVESSESSLEGRSPEPRVLTEAAATAASSIEPLSDIHGSSDYRRRLIEVMVSRALSQATGRLAHV
ncbi:MAG: xanthine dehydrogenase family protein subunit M [Acidimicrobiia bacterium]